jgi:YfiH family protein
MPSAASGGPTAAGTAPLYTELDDFQAFGVRALITTRAAGDFALSGAAPVGEVLARWEALRAALGAAGPGSRFATAFQVHGTRLLHHGSGWAGWLRGDHADAHFAGQPGIGLGVTVADCVPVFLAHPTRAVALVHAGWRGTAAGILRVAIAAFQSAGASPADVRVHLGPAICGRCYEVGPDVYAQLTGSRPSAPRAVDLRAILADQARAAGVRVINTSPSCTRCDNDVYFSHRAGDAARQVAVIRAELPP